MANRIKGITIQIGGDTTKLQTALKKVNSTLNQTERDLKDVNRLLKLNPGNTELIRQKQVMLKTAIEQTKEKIKQEEAALRQLQSAGNRERNIQQENALQREIIETKGKLEMLEKEERELGAAAVATGNKMEQQARKGQRVNKTLGKIKGSLRGMVGLAAAAFSVGAIIQFGKATLEASAAQTEAETKLETIMKKRMQSTDKQIQKIKDLTAAEQKNGVIGDEVQLAGSQQLATFLKQEKSLETLIPAMNDLAAQQKGVNATSSDMTSIANLMGKAMNGNVGALKRVGISFDESQAKVLKYGTEEEKAAMLAEVISQNVGDMNQVLAETDAGKIQQAKNAFGDMKEEIGAKLLPVLAQLAEKLLPIINAFTDFIEAASNPDTEIGAQFQSLADFASSCADAFNKFNSSLGGTSNGINVLKYAMFQLKVIMAVVTGVAMGVRGAFQFLSGLVKGMTQFVKDFAQGWVELARLIKTSVQTAVSWIQKISTKVTTVVNAVKQKFSEIYDKFVKPFEDAYDKISGIVDDLKSLFPIDIGKVFENIKLPKFSWSLKQAGDSKLKMPDFHAIRWFGSGGIFNNPSIIGVGERGAEAVIPLNTLWAKMDAIADAGNGTTINVYGSPGMNVKELADEVEKVIIQNNNRRRQAWA